MTIKYVHHALPSVYKKLVGIILEFLTDGTKTCMITHVINGIVIRNKPMVNPKNAIGKFAHSFGVPMQSMGRTI
ncbi:MAG: hypothetical protein ACP5JP_05610, partial [bacterium]